MKKIPRTEKASIIRTDFTNDAAWKRLQTAVQSPPEPFLFAMEIVDDQNFDQLTNEKLPEQIPDNYLHSFIVLADATSLSAPNFPLLVIDLLEDPGREFRCEAAHLASIENNLSIGNMGFEEFADSVDDSGIFSGFPR